MSNLDSILKLSSKEKPEHTLLNHKPSAKDEVFFLPEASKTSKMENIMSFKGT